MSLRRYRCSARTIIAIASVLLMGVLAAACGGSAEPSGTTATEGAAVNGEANEADRAFLATMSAHHAGGVALGEIAQERGENPETRKLGRAVETAQSRELEQMQTAYEDLFGEPLTVDRGPDPAIAALEEAQEFDRDFYDALIPHHQEAIEMAREEVAGGQNPELIQLAQSIIETQSQEIEDMNTWREKYYGSASPAGGVPPEG